MAASPGSPLLCHAFHAAAACRAPTAPPGPSRGSHPKVGRPAPLPLAVRVLRTTHHHLWGRCCEVLSLKDWALCEELGLLLHWLLHWLLCHLGLRHLLLRHLALWR